MAGRVLKYDHPPHLPPIAAAPILEHYDPDLKRVDDTYRLDAPVDDRLVVDIFKTVEVALALVDPDYKWPRCQPKKDDIHHFVWERDNYHPRHYSGSIVPRDYRDLISFHKGYMPRQFHEFLHAVIRPPEVPDFSVMEARVRDYMMAKQLFESARGAVTAKERPHKIPGVPVGDTGEVLLDEEILLQIMINFEGYFTNSLKLVDSENVFVPTELLDKHSPEVVATRLGRLAAVNSVNFMPHIYKRRSQIRAVA